jgi:hypothetical protein
VSEPDRAGDALAALVDRDRAARVDDAAGRLSPFASPSSGSGGSVRLDRLPEPILAQTFPALCALVCLFKQALKAWVVSQQEALQILILADGD